MNRAMRKEMLEFLNLISLKEIHKNRQLKKQTGFLKKYLSIDPHNWETVMNEKESPFPFIIQKERNECI